MTEVNNIRIFPIIGSSIIKMFKKNSPFPHITIIILLLCIEFAYTQKIHLLYILIWLK